MDTLLRLAEEPAFYVPKWSPHIIQELEKTLKNRFHYSPEQVQRRIQAMEQTFPSAMVTGYENLIDSMENDPKDRHVLAAAVKCGAHAIVSDNVKHFPVESLTPYSIECMTADEFLEHQYHLNPDAFIGVLAEQAMDIGWTLTETDFEACSLTVEAYQNSLEMLPRIQFHIRPGARLFIH
jgi:predicted nucleic acid-binding protein